ncbi:MAG: glycosyltransferase [Candidatus Eisenbacteria bacterium]|nr:glycosyltransferase [Candidatus Eisenbacteria bacterium]
MLVELFFYRFFDRTGRSITIGGVQTYIRALAGLLSDLGHEPVLYQLADVDFERDAEALRVVGVKATGVRPDPLIREADRNARGRDRVRVFCADHFSIRTTDPRSALIQHGVSWDLPTALAANHPVFRLAPLAGLWKYVMMPRYARMFQNCPNRVCVDHNFLNWYRCVVGSTPPGRTWVIPNFAEAIDDDQLDRKLSSRRSEIKVLFARRFRPLRGTRVMVPLIRTVLAKRKDVRFTLAGEGPDERFLRESLGDQRRVEFVTYGSAEATDVCARHDIVIVPSMGSEGTSLSVAEGMAAGCAVVATNVGGMTNMIVDSHNGLLSLPELQDLEAKLMKAITDADLRKRLARNAYMTATEAFSRKLWCERWTDVIEELTRG